MSSNPYATPATEALSKPQETEHDRYIIGQVTPMLEPGERIKWTAYMMKAPSLILQVLFMGLIMLFFIRYYLVAVTNKRLILIRTRNFWMKPKMENRGTEEIRWEQVTTLKVGGVANNRSIDFRFKDGTSRTLRIAPWFRFVSGQKAFFEMAQAFDPAKLEAE